MKDFKSLLKTKFVFLWVSQMLSQLTIYIMNFLLLLKLFSETKSSIATSFLWIAYALPALIIGPFAAAIVDMANKKRVLIVTNLLQALVVFLYAIKRSPVIFLPYGLAMTYSSLNQFYLPSEASSVPELVSKDKLPFANSLFLITQQISMIVGFGLAGLLNQFLGFEKSVILCSVFLFSAFVSVTFLPNLPSKYKIAGGFESAFLKFFKDVYAGYEFIKKNKFILYPFLLIIYLQVLLAVITVNVPILTTQILKFHENFSGVMIVVPAAIGSIIGSIITPKLLKNGVRKKKLIDASIYILAASVLIFIFLLQFLPVFIKIIMSILVITAVGISFVGSLVPAQTFLQEKTPGGIRGRVFGNMWFLVTAATIFPVVFSGTIIEFLGIRFLIVILALSLLLIAFYSKKFGSNLLSEFV